MGLVKDFIIQRFQPTGLKNVFSGSKNETVV